MTLLLVRRGGRATDRDDTSIVSEAGRREGSGRRSAKPSIFEATERYRARAEGVPDASNVQVQRLARTSPVVPRRAPARQTVLSITESAASETRSIRATDDVEREWKGPGSVAGIHQVARFGDVTVSPLVRRALGNQPQGMQDVVQHRVLPIPG